jgi:hypothetical protein
MTPSTAIPVIVAGVAISHAFACAVVLAIWRWHPDRDRVGESEWRFSAEEFA